MTFAFRRSVTALLCGAAVIAATFAWTATVYLASWADGGSGVRVARAVIDDPDARAEILAPITAQLASLVGDSDGARRAEETVLALLDDPATRAAFTDAFASADGEIGIDPAAARDVLVERLGAVDPELAALLDGGNLPDLQVPEPTWLSAANRIAEQWRWTAAMLAVGLFAVAYVVGDRVVVARRYAAWAMVSGVFWLVGPWLVGRGARLWAPSADATATVMVDAYAAPIRPWAVVLVLSGVVAVVVTVMMSRVSHLTGSVVDRAARDEADVMPSTVPPAAAPNRGPSPARPVPAVATVGPVDRFEPSGQSPPPVQDLRPTATEVDIDVWAAYRDPRTPPRA